ncbi:hypothetical protein I316_03616 [Kwoniella heveanensis BCC8398]|uniref:Uncharacterized protein n=1 Tax=Kwoniella heveanensis BCC8398 TaxID=1296120 RepID=A0A1B9GUL8_9TREE|nr:hypothetical protein I316_03616 [Kwoniella heveanensis BCC8398]
MSDPQRIDTANITPISPLSTPESSLPPIAEPLRPLFTHQPLDRSRTPSSGSGIAGSHSKTQQHPPTSTFAHSVASNPLGIEGLVHPYGTGTRRSAIDDPMNPFLDEREYESRPSSLPSIEESSPRIDPSIPSSQQSLMDRQSPVESGTGTQSEQEEVDLDITPRAETRPRFLDTSQIDPNPFLSESPSLAPQSRQELIDEPISKSTIPPALATSGGSHDPPRASPRQSFSQAEQLSDSPAVTTAEGTTTSHPPLPGGSASASRPNPNLTTEDPWEPEGTREEGVKARGTIDFDTGVRETHITPRLDYKQKAAPPLLDRSTTAGQETLSIPNPGQAGAAAPGHDPNVPASGSPAGHALASTGGQAAQHAPQSEHIRAQGWFSRLMIHVRSLRRNIAVKLGCLAHAMDEDVDREATTTPRSRSPLQARDELHLNPPNDPPPYVVPPPPGASVSSEEQQLSPKSTAQTNPPTIGRGSDDPESPTKKSTTSGQAGKDIVPAAEDNLGDTEAQQTSRNAPDTSSSVSNPGQARSSPSFSAALSLPPGLPGGTEAGSGGGSGEPHGGENKAEEGGASSSGPGRDEGKDSKSGRKSEDSKKKKSQRRAPAGQLPPSSPHTTQTTQYLEGETSETPSQAPPVEAPAYPPKAHRTTNPGSSPHISEDHSGPSSQSASRGDPEEATSPMTYPPPPPPPESQAPGRPRNRGFLGGVQQVTGLLRRSLDMGRSGNGGRSGSAATGGRGGKQAPSSQDMMRETPAIVPPTGMPPTPSTQPPKEGVHKRTPSEGHKAPEHPTLWEKVKNRTGLGKLSSNPSHGRNKRSRPHTAPAASTSQTGQEDPTPVQGCDPPPKGPHSRFGYGQNLQETQAGPSRHRDLSCKAETSQEPPSNRPAGVTTESNQAEELQRPTQGSRHDGQQRRLDPGQVSLQDEYPGHTRDQTTREQRQETQQQHELQEQVSMQSPLGPGLASFSETRSAIEAWLRNQTQTATAQAAAQLDHRLCAVITALSDLTAADLEQATTGAASSLRPPLRSQRHVSFPGIGSSTGTPPLARPHSSVETTRQTRQSAEPAPGSSLVLGPTKISSLPTPMSPLPPSATMAQAGSGSSRGTFGQGPQRSAEQPQYIQVPSPIPTSQQLIPPLTTVDLGDNGHSESSKSGVEINVQQNASAIERKPLLSDITTPVSSSGTRSPSYAEGETQLQNQSEPSATAFKDQGQGAHTPAGGKLHPLSVSRRDEAAERSRRATTKEKGKWKATRSSSDKRSSQGHAGGSASANIESLGNEEYPSTSEPVPVRQDVTPTSPGTKTTQNDLKRSSLNASTGAASTASDATPRPPHRVQMQQQLSNVDEPVTPPDFTAPTASHGTVAMESSTERPAELGQGGSHELDQGFSLPPVGGETQNSDYQPETPSITGISAYAFEHTPPPQVPQRKEQSSSLPATPSSVDALERSSESHPPSTSASPDKSSHRIAPAGSTTSKALGQAVGRITETKPFTPGVSTGGKLDPPALSSSVSALALSEKSHTGKISLSGQDASDEAESSSDGLARSPPSRDPLAHLQDDSSGAIKTGAGHAESTQAQDPASEGKANWDVETKQSASYYGINPNPQAGPSSRPYLATPPAISAASICGEQPVAEPPDIQTDKTSHTPPPSKAGNANAPASDSSISTSFGGDALGPCSHTTDHASRDRTPSQQISDDPEPATGQTSKHGSPRVSSLGTRSEQGSEASSEHRAEHRNPPEDERESKNKREIENEYESEYGSEYENGQESEHDGEQDTLPPGSPELEYQLERLPRAVTPLEDDQPILPPDAQRTGRSGRVRRAWDKLTKTPKK